jgi:hypothetical protein
MKASKKTEANKYEQGREEPEARKSESMLSDGMTREEAAASLGVKVFLYVILLRLSAQKKRLRHTIERFGYS